MDAQTRRREREAVSAAIDWDGQTRQPCPECSRSPKDRTCGVTVDPDGHGVAHCFRCEYVETRRADCSQVRPGTGQKRATAPFRHEALSTLGCALWGDCRPLSGPAIAYLNARHCVIPPADGHLRLHPALKHGPSGIVGPALVALVTDAVTGQPLTLHRTWIQRDGAKAPLDPPRMYLGGHRKAGGVVRLWPDESVTMGLGIAEGIESALSLAHAYQPVWACLDAGNMAALPVLAGIESLMIAADHDKVGIGAAESCGARWADADREVRIVMPEAHKADLNDIARAA